MTHPWIFVRAATVRARSCVPALLLAAAACRLGAAEPAPADPPPPPFPSEGPSPAKSQISPPWRPARSVAYLVQNQREDGTWAIGLQVNPDSAGGVTVGTTALASLALLEYSEHDPEGVKAAVGKGTQACLARVYRKKKSANDFESTAWGQIYTVELLARLAAHPAFKDDLPKWKERAAEVLGCLYLRQHEDGGFGYENSFHTAAVLLGLARAKEAGFEVDGERVRRGLAFLEGLRTDRGYRYSLGHTKEYQAKQRLDKALNDTAGRLGACAAALHVGGRIRDAELEAEMKTFMDHRAPLWKARAATKEDRWPRLEGASPYAYFAFFAYRYSALALKRLPEDRRKEWGAPLRADLHAVRELDDTWINLPIAYEASKEDRAAGFESNTAPGSKVYATAMALLALKDLE